MIKRLSILLAFCFVFLIAPTTKAAIIDGDTEKACQAVRPASTTVSASPIKAFSVSEKPMIASDGGATTCGECAMWAEFTCRYAAPEDYSLCMDMYRASNCSPCLFGRPNQTLARVVFAVRLIR